MQAVAPSIVTQPVAVVVNAGNTATFAVGVSGSGPLSYQWLRNGTPIAGATAAFHTIAQAAAGDAGAYSVRVSNGVGPVTSAAATLTVNAGTAGSAPAISTPPATLVVAPGGSATLAVAASGSGPLAYQWLHDGAVVVGQTGAVYHFTSVSALDVGAYQVRVSNALGEVTSAAAQLLVVGAPAVTTAAREHQRDGGQQRELQRRRQRRCAALPVAARQRGDRRRHRHELHHAHRAGRQRRALQRARLQQRGAAVQPAGHAHRHRPELSAEWETPAAIETDDTGNAQQPSIAVNAAGEAVAVWMQPGGGVGINIWANRYTPAGGWGTARAHLRWRGRRSRRPGGGDRRERPRDRRLAAGGPHLGQPLHPRQRLERRRW